MLVAVGVAWTYNEGWERYGLATCAALCVLSIPLWRGTWTFVVGTALIAGLGAGAYLGGPVAEALAGAIIGVGGFGGLRAAGEAIRRPTSRSDGSDVAVVASAFFLPVVLSKAGLGLTTISCGVAIGSVFLT